MILNTSDNKHLTDKSTLEIPRSPLYNINDARSLWNRGQSEARPNFQRVMTHFLELSSKYFRTGSRYMGTLLL